MASLGTLAVNIVARTQKFAAGVTKSLSLTRRFTSGLAPMTAGLGAAAAGTIALARAHDQLQQAMNQSLAIMPDISMAMRGDMQRAAIDTARVTRFSATEAARAYFFLASAGMDAQQSLRAMPQVAKFAQAGNFDLALATDLATDAQSALGLSVRDATKNLANLTRVTDVLVKGNTLANTSAQQLSEAITNKAGAALRLANKGIEEGAAVLLAYADQGIKGAEAGTALGIVMRDLQTKALKNAAAFRAAGIAVFDQNGNMNRLADIIGDVEQKLDGMSTAQAKATLLSVGFSDKSVAYIQTLIGTSEKIRGYEDALRGAAGITDEVAGKQLTTMQKATSRLSAEWENLLAQITPVVDVTAAWITGSAEMLAVMAKQGSLITTVAETLHFSRIVWLGFSVAVKSVATAFVAFARILVAIPEMLFGIDNGLGKWLDSVVTTLDAATQETQRQFNEALTAKTPTEKMQAFLRKTQREAEKTAETIERVTKPTVGESLQASVGSVFSRGMGYLGMAAGKARDIDAARRKMLVDDALHSLSFGFLGKKSPLRGSPSIAGSVASSSRTPQLVARTAGSVDTFAAARRNTRDKTAENHLEVSKRQLKEMRRQRELLATKAPVFSFGAPA